MTGDASVPAATVVVFRHAPTGGAPELLMVQRARELRFAGGAAVFPGGRVDQADRELAVALLPDEDPELSAARVAAIRETLEETGLLIAARESVSAAQAAAARAMLVERTALAPVLDHFGWTLALDRLIWFAHWCPRIERPFDTHFFVTDLGTGAVDIAVDATENTRLFWASAREALRLADSGEISLLFPTRLNLERLALASDFAAARDQAERYPPRCVVPDVIERDGDQWLTIPDGFGYPVIERRLNNTRRG